MMITMLTTIMVTMLTTIIITMYNDNDDNNV